MLILYIFKFLKSILIRYFDFTIKLNFQIYITIYLDEKIKN